MQRVLVDTSVLYAAAYGRDENHDRGLAILQGFDAGELPEPVVLDFVLAETLNGLTIHAGHDAAVDFLDRIEANERFHVERPAAHVLAAAKDHFRAHARLSFVDAVLLASARRSDLRYCYAFDDDFDGFDGLDRLDAAVDPYSPE